MTDQIYLGRDHDGSVLRLSKHEWHCGWYLAFGYIGNRHLHMHISALIKHPSGGYYTNWSDVSAQFKETWITQAQWWIIRDVFLSAYALADAAKAYRHGGHQTEDAAKVKLRPQDPIGEMQFTINADLRDLLDRFWSWLEAEHAKAHK